MSRTKRGSKCLGHDYWSARPLNRGGGLIGAFTKTLTSRIERRVAKRETMVEVRNTWLQQLGDLNED